MLLVQSSVAGIRDFLTRTVLVVARFHRSPLENWGAPLQLVPPSLRGQRRDKQRLPLVTTGWSSGGYSANGTRQLLAEPTLGPVCRKVLKLFMRISGDIILSVSSKRRRLEARNVAVILIFLPFTTHEKTSFTEQVGRNFTNGFSGLSRNGPLLRKDGPAVLAGHFVRIRTESRDLARQEFQKLND